MRDAEGRMRDAGCGIRDAKGRLRRHRRAPAAPPDMAPGSPGWAGALLFPPEKEEQPRSQVQQPLGAPLPPCPQRHLAERGPGCRRYRGFGEKADGFGIGHLRNEWEKCGKRPREFSLLVLGCSSVWQEIHGSFCFSLVFGRHFGFVKDEKKRIQNPLFQNPYKPNCHAGRAGSRAERFWIRLLEGGQPRMSACLCNRAARLLCLKHRVSWEHTLYLSE